MTENRVLSYPGETLGFGGMANLKKMEEQDVKDLIFLKDIYDNK